MNIKLKQVVLSSGIFLLLDTLYFSSVAGTLFQRVIRQVQKEPLQFNLTGAVFAYLFLFAALNYFILQSPAASLQAAFVLGVVIYGVYEMTNYALFKHWSPAAVVIDTLWGGIVFALTTYLTRRLLLSI